jgi:signal transduction histidine kinase
MQKLGVTSWIVLAVSISITLIVWDGFSYSLTNAQNQFFEDDAELMTLLIADELKQYEQVLVGARGLFAASDDVTLSEWRSFVEIQDIETRFPGLQGVAYVEHTLHEDRGKLITEMKSYGFDAFDIKPAGNRDEYYPVLFLEPLDLRNQKAIGYDIYFEQTRKNTINTLIETGDTTITEKITLVQEIDDDVQNGFLMLVPVYSNDNPDRLQGIVDIVIRINDFVQGTVDAKSFEHLRLKIYDDHVSDENLFFNSDEIFDYEFGDPDFSTEINTSVNNRNWVFVYEGIQSPLAQTDHLLLFVIPIVGFSMSLLLFYTFRVISKNLKLSQEAINNEKITAIGTMTSRMSHDLKNPLSVISISLELLQKNLGSNMDEKSKNVVKRIENSIKLITSIINDVLEFAKSSKLHKEKVSLNLLLENVISNISVPPTVQINLPENEISINCDKNKMESVFLNLISNSIQSIKDEGIITISFEDDSENTIISVVDSGAGVPNNEITQIFEPLFSTKPSGTGLGLVICKNIVEQHGGQISVHNNPTTFTIKLPKR